MLADFVAGIRLPCATDAARVCADLSPVKKSVGRTWEGIVALQAEEDFSIHYRCEVNFALDTGSLELVAVPVTVGTVDTGSSSRCLVCPLSSSSTSFVWHTRQSAHLAERHFGLLPRIFLLRPEQLVTTTVSYNLQYNLHR